VIKYNKEPDEKSGDGTRAMRRQGGTTRLVHGVARKRNAANITTVRENPKAAGGWLSRGLLKVLGVRCPSAENCAEQRKKIPYIRSETEKMEKPEVWPKKGPHDGTRTRTHVGMSKGLDLRNKGQESTSHQAALVTGRINLIYTRRK
jgi:hypothetical protein